MRGWPLVGRAEELDAISELLLSTSEHHCVAIIGRAGVGKTRLAHEAADLAKTRGYQVRWIVGTLSSRDIPMGAFGEWTDALDGNPHRAVLPVAAGLRGSADRPALLIVDDAHLLDDQSALVLQQLVALNVTNVALTVRSGDACSDAVASIWRDGPARLIEIQPLARDQSDELAQAALGGTLHERTAARLWDMTKGNVLYLRELINQERTAGRLARRGGVWVWGGTAEVGQTLIDLVGLQVGTGTDPIHDVVDLVTVGEPLERSCLAALADPALIAQAEDRGLIAATTEADVDTVRVGHPLYAEVRRARAGQLRLRRMRGMVARQLPDDADPIRRGLLWLDSDLEPDTALLLQAAEHAGIRLDFELAQRLAAAAVDAGAGIEAQIIQVHSLILMHRGAEAEAVLGRMELDHVPEQTWANVTHLRIANLLWPQARPADAWLVACDVPPIPASPIVAAHRAAMRSICLAMAARPASATAAMAGVNRDALGPLPALLALWALTVAHGDLGAPHLAATFASEGYRRAAAAPEATYQGVGITEFHVSAMALAGLLAEANDAAEHTYERCADAPGVARTVAAATKGLSALYRGDVAVAVSQLSPACADFEAYGDTSGVFYRFSLVCTEALARSGNLRAATVLQQKMHDARHPTFEFVAVDSLLADCWVAAVHGRVTEATALARRAADLAQMNGQLAREVHALQTLLQLGSTDPGIVERLSALATVVDGPRAALAARYAVALQQADADALDTVAAELLSMGDQLAAADAFAQASSLHKSGGRRGSALTSANRAHQIITACGAISPATRAARSELPLNPREYEIAAMVAQGMSNKAIAEVLTIPVRTVEGHIYRACGKLGITGRRKLAALAATHHGPK